MDTVTTTPASGTVEHYADLMRRHAHRWTNIRLLALELVDVVATADGFPDAVRVERIRNVLIAANLVAAELTAAGR